MSCNFHQNEILHVPDRLWRDPRFAAKAAKQYRFIHGHLRSEFICNLVGFPGPNREFLTRSGGARSILVLLSAATRIPNPKATRTPVSRSSNHRSLSLAAFVSHTNPVIASMVGNFQLQMLLTNAPNAPTHSDMDQGGARKPSEVSVRGDRGRRSDVRFDAPHVPDLRLDGNRQCSTCKSSTTLQL